MSKKLSYFIFCFECFNLCMLFLSGCSNTKTTSDWYSGEPEEIIRSFENDYVAIDDDMEFDEYFDSSLCNEEDDNKFSLKEVSYILSNELFVLNDGKIFISSNDLANCIPCSGVIRNDDGDLFVNSPTLFFDENALLCVQVTIHISAEGKCELIKYYYFLNGNVYPVQNCCEESSLLIGGKWFVPFEEVCNSLNIAYKVDNSLNQVIISGGCFSAEKTDNVLYQPIYPKTSGGYVWTTNGTRCNISDIVGEENQASFTSSSVDEFIPVKAGEHLKVTMYSSWMPEVATMIYMNEDNRVVSYVSTQSSTYFNNQILVVPQGATKLLLSLYTNQTYEFYREITIRGAKLDAITLDEYTNGMKTILMQNAKEPISFRNSYYDKTYITFVIDDLRNDIDRIVSIFEEYGLPVCIANPGGMVFASSLGQESRYEVCKRAVENGGEILAHSSEAITEENKNDLNTMFDTFFARKYMLNSYGFVVDGVILSGGAGQIVGDETTDMYARMFYKYSDLYGKESLGEPFFHRRTWIDHIKDNVDEYINNITENKTWDVLYFHDLNEINESELRELLHKICNNSDKIQVVTYAYIYDINR